MTLNCIRWNFHRILQISDSTTAKRMKIDQYCQRQRCKQQNVLFNIVFLTFIAIDFFARRLLYTHCCRALTLALARLSCSRPKPFYYAPQHICYRPSVRLSDGWIIEQESCDIAKTTARCALYIK